MSNILRTKCVVIGDSAVGKTALVQVFLHDRTYFPKNYSMTTGVSLSVGKVNIPETKDTVEIYLHDCSGKDIYQDFTQELWSDSPLAVIVFDTCSSSSLNSMLSVHVLFHAVVCLITGILVGTKADLKERRSVSLKGAQEMAKRIGFQYFECSSKEAEGVQEPFFYLASQWHKLVEKDVA
ncbi:unnamed protein product [Ixodes pacificus]